MPNIVAFGFTKKDYEILFKRIVETFANEPYADEIVVTRTESKTKDLKSRPQPYLQLEMDCMKGYKKKTSKLKTLGFDIQVVQLHEFIPKE